MPSQSSHVSERMARSMQAPHVTVTRDPRPQRGTFCGPPNVPPRGSVMSHGRRLSEPMFGCRRSGKPKDGATGAHHEACSAVGAEVLGWGSGRECSH